MLQIRTITTLQTPTASRYITRLCKHWGHKFAVDFDAQRGHIDFNGPTCELLATETALHIAVTAPAADLEKLQAVVVEHLQRFAPRNETLLFATWERKSTPFADTAGQP